MKTSTAVVTASAIFAGSAYGGATMKAIMKMKLDQRAEQRAKGLIGTAESTQKMTPCVNGKAGQYNCANIDMLAFMSHGDMGSRAKEGNDVWGWTGSDGREFALVGQVDGTAFVEVLEDGSLDYIGRLPTQTVNSNWRDIKVVKDHAYIGSEAGRHGMQVFDLNKLFDVKPKVDSSFKPKKFNPATDLTALYTGFGSSHNIVANEDTDMVYAVGTANSAGCLGGLWMLDVSDPENPVSPGCVSSGGYVHDAQCVLYEGVDERFNGHEICFNYNENALVIVDVTNKTVPEQLSAISYRGVGYTHQGWVADPEFRTLLLDDELDEMAGVNGGRTTTYIFDISDLVNPRWTGTYVSPATSVDHNMYVLDGIAYQANYGSGLRMVDVSSVVEDNTGSGFEELGFFDCYPEDDGNPQARFYGTWSVYPYFESGNIILNSIERGLFTLKYSG